MKIRFLGTAAGGGCPQWNCACPQCGLARVHGNDRTQDCLAVSGDGRVWYLVNASPDLRAQVLRAPELTPGPALRDTPVRGVLLTSAELDHTLGLLTLREAESLAIHASPTVLGALPWLPILDYYVKADRRPMVCGEPFSLDGGLTVTAFPVSDKQPRYTSEPPAADWVVGLRITGSGGRSVAYLPGLAVWTDGIAAAIAGADVVVLDGTFFSDGESAICGHVVGHLPIQDSLPFLRSHPGPRYLYTHLNNTNPLSDPYSPYRTVLAEAGAEVAPEDGLIEL
jgi:pyrroloquinoline quinone biosynthesis protein B